MTKGVRQLVGKTGVARTPSSAECLRQTNPCQVTNLEIGIGGVVARCRRVGPGEFRPEPLTEPDGNLSIHPARATPERLPPAARQ
jgi:hypothetical protein